VLERVELAMPTLPTGTLLKTVAAPNQALSSLCAEVDPKDSNILQLAADLITTMHANKGCVGLAANQVGRAVRVFALDVSDHPKTTKSHGLFVLINPEIVSSSRNEKSREGCLSVPDFTGDVKRATQLTITGYLPGSDSQITIETQGFEAKAIGHEIDHLNGYLFLDRVAGAHAIFPRKRYL
jgi:peptide deformylase